MTAESKDRDNAERYCRTIHLRFFDLKLPKYKTFIPSETAAAISSIPSSLKSPNAKPYTTPVESPKETGVKLWPDPSLKKTVEGALTWPTIISIFPSLFIFFCLNVSSKYGLKRSRVLADRGFMWRRSRIYARINGSSKNVLEICHLFYTPSLLSELSTSFLCRGVGVSVLLHIFCAGCRSAGREISIPVRFRKTIF